MCDKSSAEQKQLFVHGVPNKNCCYETKKNNFAPKAVCVITVTCIIFNSVGNVYWLAVFTSTFSCLLLNTFLDDQDLHSIYFLFCNFMYLLTLL